MDRLTSIEVFIAAVDEGSLVAAGRRFGLSASMAGKYLTGLETELNVCLIKRSTRRLSLTDAGKRYYDRCKRILDEFDDANREASDASLSLHGVLRIAAPVTFGTLHMGNVIGRFLQDHPQINVSMRLDDRYLDLHDDNIDVAIRIGRLADSSLIARRLAPCRMVLCAAPAYLKRAGTPRLPEDLHHSPRLAFSEEVSMGAWTLYDENQQPHPIDGPIRMQANNVQMLLDAALAGIGITYGPSFVFGKYLAGGELINLLPAYRTKDLTVQAVYPAMRYTPSRIRQFIDYLVADFGDIPPWERF
ncbi:LysR family transcriptional regulator [Sodalis ligni]|uniref:LysR family transcriptional regulator n=1 Tax=Sodalis ligni TaxID=2697027 RepID=UPI0019400FFA|nr:LysR family transcriptional regulator [Sodalis ligni]QWA10906.1 LysR family transcriptional regulator [Sodalis ligni]